MRQEKTNPKQTPSGRRPFLHMGEEGIRKTRVILSSVACGILLCALSAAFLCALAARIRAQQRDTALAYAEQTAAALMLRVRGELETLSVLADAVEGDSDEAARSALQGACANLSYKRMGAVDADGLLYDTNGLTADVSEDAFFIQIETAGFRLAEGEISGLLTDVTDGARVLAFSAPLEGGGFVFGVRDAEQITSALGAELPAAQATAGVVDAEGNEIFALHYAESIFAVSPGEREEALLARRELYAPMAAACAAQGSCVLYENGARYAVVRGALDGWYLIVRTEDTPVYREPAFLLALGFTLLLTLTGLWLHRRGAQMRERAKKEIERAARTDAVTGLQNAAGFAACAAELLRETERKYFIIDIGVSDYESVTALHGAERAEKLLRDIAALLAGQCDRDEPGAHLYAGKFICLMHAVNAETVLARLVVVDRELSRAGDSLLVRIRYGVYEIDDPALPIREMLDRAAVARKSVLQDSQNQIGFYDDRMHREYTENSAMLARMEQALTKQEFRAYYQPKYDINSGGIIGAEVLARWAYPNGELRSPARFIELFEKNGRIAKLDFYMLEMACIFQKTLRAHGAKRVPLSVNFSRAHLHDLNFVDELLKVLHKHGVPPRLIEIEFTESAVLEDTELLLLTLKVLHKVGFTVSIDDFGSGYSSLNLLRSIPVDTVKLDKAFLDQIENDARGRTIVEGVLRIARQLNLHTIAEGVETEEQRTFLRENGCEAAQGFLYAEPMPEQDFLAVMTNPDLRTAK